MVSAIVGAIVGALAVLPVAILKQRIDRSRAAATLDVAKQWFIDRYEQISFFDGQFLRLLHAIEHVRGDRRSFPGESSDEDRYFSMAINMSREIRDHSRAEVATVGLPFVSAIENATDAAMDWLSELNHYNRFPARDPEEAERQKIRLDQLEMSYWDADSHRLRVRRELLEQRIPPTLR